MLVYEHYLYLNLEVYFAMTENSHSKKKQQQATDKLQEKIAVNPKTKVDNWSAPTQSIPLFFQVVETIKSRILNHEYAPGDSLPSA